MYVDKIQKKHLLYKDIIVENVLWLNQLSKSAREQVFYASLW